MLDSSGDEDQKLELNLEFELSVTQITDLFENRNVDDFNEYGGAEKIAKMLRTDLETGLCEAQEGEFKERKRVYGTNNYPEPPHATFLELFFEAFTDTAIIILCIAAIVSLVVGIIEYVTTPEGHEKEPSYIEGIAILVAVLIVAFVSSINNYNQGKQFRAKSKLEQNINITVLRDGDEKQISIHDLVVGDIVLLNTGKSIPGDGMYVDGFDLYLDESTVTGEITDVRKSEESPILFSGCKVSAGNGRMLVLAVGINSEFGRFLSELQVEQEETPLQEKLESMVIVIGKIGTGVAIAVVIVLIIYWINDEFIKKVDGTELGIGNFFGLLHAFIIGITIVVVAVPEGLPLAVTLSLVYSMGRMMEDNNFVRHLSACETMGGATNICSDKTGTLTENKMTVIHGEMAGHEFEFDDIPSLEDVYDKKVLDIICEGICINSDAYLEKKVKDGKDIVEFNGSKTEGALLVFCEKIGYHYKDVRAQHTKHRLFAFSSARKRMSTMVPFPEYNEKQKKKAKKLGKNYIDENQGYRLYIKGACEIIIQNCTRILEKNGSIRDITEEDKDNILKQQIALSVKGIRTLGFGYRDFDGGEAWEKPTDVEDDIIFVGIVGIEDPLREGVEEAVKTCQRAGIIVRMVTGDNILTAKKIAGDCGILSDGGIAMEGPDFRKLGPKELDDILPRLQVLARSSPTDKYILVKRLRTNGEVVAVTGDGTNDAPALKEADVGLSMGICGTEVAKHASDIVILDDNFTSIVKSVKWGRSVYDNIRKFLQFQLTVNIVALLTAFFGAIFNFGTPLNAVQLLWVNLIMDTLAALAFSTEKPTNALLNRRPHGRDGKLISYVMWRNIASSSLYQFSMLLLLLFLYDSRGNHLLISGADNGQNYGGRANIHYTIIFNTFVFMQIFNEFNSRKCDRSNNVFAGLHKNIIFVFIIFGTIGIQIIVVQFTGIFTKCVPLTFNQWMLSVTLGFLSLPFSALIRLTVTPCIPKEFWEYPTDAENSIISRLLASK